MSVNQDSIQKQSVRFSIISLLKHKILSSIRLALFININQ